MTSTGRGQINVLIRMPGTRTELEDRAGVWRMTRQYATYDEAPDRYLEGVLATGAADEIYPLMFVDRVTKNAERGGATFFEVEYRGLLSGSPDPQFRVIGQVPIVGNNAQLSLAYRVEGGGGGVPLDITAPNTYDVDDVPVIKSAAEFIVMDGWSKILRVTYVTGDTSERYTDRVRPRRVGKLPPVPNTKLKMGQGPDLPESSPSIDFAITAADRVYEQFEVESTVTLAPRILPYAYRQIEIGGGYWFIDEQLIAVLGIMGAGDQVSYTRSAAIYRSA